MQTKINVMKEAELHKIGRWIGQVEDIVQGVRWKKQNVNTCLRAYVAGHLRDLQRVPERSRGSSAPCRGSVRRAALKHVKSVMAYSRGDPSSSVYQLGLDRLVNAGEYVSWIRKRAELRAALKYWIKKSVNSALYTYQNK